MKAQNTINTENTDSTILKGAPSGETTKPQADKDGKKKSSTWQNVLVGGVPGILLGALGVGLATASSPAPDPDPNPEDPQPGSPVDHTNFEVHEAHSVNDDMTFNEAFAAARAEVGPGGAFVWHGHVYGTYRGDDPEWQEMSVEDRNAHSNHIISQVHATPYTPSENEPDIVPLNQENNNEDQQDDNSNTEPGNDQPEDNSATETSDNQPEETSDEDSQAEQGDTEESEVPADETDEVEEVIDTEELESEVDVHIVGVENVELEDGSEIQVGYGEVDGVSAAFIDSDGDGEVDTVLIDTDNDGQPSLDEVFDAEGSGITMDALAAEAEANSVETLDDQLYSDMPDYTNDADMSDLA